MKKINQIALIFLFILTLSVLFACGKECLHENVTTEITKEVTCTNDGKKVTKCLDCGAILKEERIDATGHVDDEPIVITKATCISVGEFVINCKNCGIELDSGVTPMLYHQLTEEIIEATCAKEGEKITKCINCGKIINIENIPMTDHDDGIWVVDKEATETSEGVMSRRCLGCNAVLETKIIPVNHVHEVVIDEKVLPTCNEPGKEEGSHCVTCGAVLVVQTEIPALSHNYQKIEEVDSTQDASGYIKYQCENCKDEYIEEIPKKSDYDSSKPTIITVTDGDISIENNNEVLVLSNTITIIHAGEYTFKGTLNEGNIIVNASSDDKVIINLEGFTITCSTTHPIYIENADKVEISAKSSTQNFVTDNRPYEEDGTGGGIYSTCDLEIKGFKTV